MAKPYADFFNKKIEAIDEENSKGGEYVNT